MYAALGKHRFLAGVLAGVVVYTAVMAALSIERHGALRTQMNDLDEQLRSRIGVHANVIFWPLGFLFKLWPEPEFLLILTSLACGLAGLGIYFFSRLHLGDGWPAVIPAAAFLLSPIVHDANLYRIT
ncbi:MAG: DUF2079 domain-containing protein [Verrucomicrobia bacterium]|nr:DUF2079 domain-containing protein [Verrucomicrobiota bacterium]